MRQIDYNDPEQVAAAEKAIIEYVHANDIKALVHRFLIMEKTENDYKVVQATSVVDLEDGPCDILDWDDYFYGVFVPERGKDEIKISESNEYMIDMEQLRPYSDSLRDTFWDICKQVFNDPLPLESNREIIYQARAVTYVLDNTEIPVDYYVVGLIIDVMGEYLFDKEICRK